MRGEGRAHPRIGPAGTRWSSAVGFMTMRARGTKPRYWSVAEAKARLSQLISDARRGPQVIANRGREVAIVLDVDRYRRVTDEAAAAQPSEAWHSFLAYSAAVRARGGGTLAVTRRARRSSPFRAKDVL